MGMSERVARLRQQSLEAEPSVSLERARLVTEAYQKALLTGDTALIETALWLAQSDNLHLIQWQGRTGSEAEVSAYFTPQEWWKLTPDGIVWEMQQVYKNFIAWMDKFV